MGDLFDINKKIFNVGDNIFGGCVIKNMTDDNMVISTDIHGPVFVCEPLLICDKYNVELAILRDLTLLFEHTTRITAYELLLCYNINMKFKENLILRGSGTIQNLSLKKDSLRYQDNAKVYCDCDLTFVNSDMDIENIVFEEGIPHLENSKLSVNNATLYTDKIKFLDSHAYYDYHFFNKLFDKLGFNQEGLNMTKFVWDLSTFHDKQKYVEYTKEDDMWVINYETEK